MGLIWGYPRLFWGYLALFRTLLGLFGTLLGLFNTSPVCFPAAPSRDPSLGHRPRGSPKKRAKKGNFHSSACPDFGVIPPRRGRGHGRLPAAASFGFFPLFPWPQSRLLGPINHSGAATGASAVAPARGPPPPPFSIRFFFLGFPRILGAFKQNSSVLKRNPAPVLPRGRFGVKNRLLGRGLRPGTASLGHRSGEIETN